MLSNALQPLMVEVKDGRPHVSLGWAGPWSVIHLPSVLWHCWLGDMKDIQACIKLGVGFCLWWWFDCRFARLIAAVTTTTSIIISSNKTQNVTNLPELSWKMAVIMNVVSVVCIVLWHLLILCCKYRLCIMAVLCWNIGTYCQTYLTVR